MAPWQNGCSAAADAAEQIRWKKFSQNNFQKSKIGSIWKKGKHLMFCEIQ